MKSYVSDDYQGASINNAAISIHTGATPPSVSTGQLWKDTSSTPHVLRFYNGTQWVSTDASAAASLEARLSSEETSRANADTTELNARIVQGNTLQTNITNEATARASADTTLQADVNTRVLRAGDTMTGPIRVPTLVVSDILVEKAWPFTFTANDTNQKLDLYCSGTSGLESLLDILIATNTGTLSRRFSLQKQGTGIIQSGTRYNEVIGQVAPYLAVSDVEWDVANLRWRFKIVNRAPLGIPLTGTINIRLISSTPTAHQLVSQWGISSVYTNDATAYPEPVFQFAGAIQADALITNFIKKGVNYTLNTMDSILICTAGIIVTLPPVNLVGIGRSYTIKNIQNSGVTVKGSGTSQIDQVLTYTVGNKRTITVTSDGTHWWITSAF